MSLLYNTNLLVSIRHSPPPLRNDPRDLTKLDPRVLVHRDLPDLRFPWRTRLCLKAKKQQQRFTHISREDDVGGEHHCHCHHHCHHYDHSHRNHHRLHHFRKSKRFTHIRREENVGCDQLFTIKLLLSRRLCAVHRPNAGDFIHLKVVQESCVFLLIWSCYIVVSRVMRPVCRHVASYFKEGDKFLHFFFTTGVLSLFCKPD